MKSLALPSFWEAYESLDKITRRRVKKAFKLWSQNPFHPSLRFKCINHEENIWSVRINLAVRGIGLFENDTVTWFWVGDHDEYERFFK
jgi:mRNA-degrading endonuclease RelE of RelBE toxin-antitoxin system